MSTIEDALYSKLSGDASVSGLVSSRIYPGRLAQKAVLPAIRFNRISTVPVDAMRTTSTLMIARFQIDCFSAAHAQANQLSMLVKSCLEGLVETILGVSIQGIRLLGFFEDYEPENEIFRVSMDFQVQHSL